MNIDIESCCFQGPDFLYLPYKKWPKEKSNDTKENCKDIMEFKEKVVLFSHTENNCILPNMNQFSKWFSTVVVLKFIKLCRKNKNDVKEFRKEDIEEAEHM